MSYDDSRYDIAQICGNGHVVNSMAREYPAHNAPFCAKCGEPTTIKCANCNTDIRGFYHVPGYVGGGQYSPPSFCYNCGKAFPWTVAGLAAAAELIDTFEAINAEDKASLQSAVTELTKEGPRTKVAEAKYRSIMMRVGKEAADGLRSIVVEIASEAVKKSPFRPVT